MARITKNENSKTVYRYDAGARAFKKAAFLLFGLAAAMVAVAAVWFTKYMEL